MQLKIIDQPGCLYLKVQAEQVDAAAAIQFKDLMRRALTPSLQQKFGAWRAYQPTKSTAKRIKTYLCSLHPQVAKVFKLTRMDEVFDIYATGEAALKAASAAPAFKADED